jgi:hypothetical protein
LPVDIFCSSDGTQDFIKVRFEHNAGRNLLVTSDGTVFLSHGLMERLVPTAMAMRGKSDMPESYIDFVVRGSGELEIMTHIVVI